MEAQLAEILKLIARQGDVVGALEAVCRAVEKRVPGARTVIRLLDQADSQLRLAAAPSLPASYRTSAHSIAVSPRAGISGAAAWRNEIVVVADLDAVEMAPEIREIMWTHALRGCWSCPIRRATGRVSGTITMFHGAPHQPSDAEIAIVSHYADLASVALELRIAQDERQEFAERMLSLTSNLPGMVFQCQTGADGAVSFPFVGDGATALTGLAPAVIAADPESFLAGFEPRDREILAAMFRRAAETLEAVACDVQYGPPDAGGKWLMIRARPRPLAGGGVMLDGLALDISEHKTAEESLERSRCELNAHLIELERARTRQDAQSAVLMETARELTSARDAAEAASRAKSQFLSNMSHELRTPLNAIIGFSEMIKEQTFGPIGSPKYRAYALDIYESGQHLLELINEILDLAKAESGRDTLREETFGVDELMRSTMHIVRSRAERERITLGVDMPDPAPHIRADKRKLRQVLLNLVTNALKFTEAGGEVRIVCWCQPATGMVFQVVDNGIGIAPEDIPKALGLFGQVDNAFSRRHEGTGLGLPLSKSLVELHGGSFDLQSRPGVGTTVTFRLPPDRVVLSEIGIAQAV